MRSRTGLFAAVAALAATVSPMPAIIAAQTTVLPHHVQGAGAASPLAGSMQTVRGVVIARTSTGFFIQTETNSEDGDLNTSEGLFISHVIDGSLHGHAVAVTGTVAESHTMTAVQSVTSVVDLGPSTLPAAFELTTNELSAAGARDQLERFEGMRVSATMTSVSPTALDGSFFAVLAGVERPSRGPGVEAGAPPLACAAAPCDFELFDGNPERLRVDSDAVDGASIVDVGVEAFIVASGPLAFAAGHYTLLPEETLLAFGGIPQMWVEAAADDQFSVASMNLGEPPADAAARERQIAKASLMVRWVLAYPDVVAVQQAEDAAVLADLAQRINQDAAAAGEPVPEYAAQLNGFLVKSTRVAVMSAAPAGGAGVFEHEPIVLRAVIDGGPSVARQRLTLINSQLHSLANVGDDDATGQQARAQRRAQAEWLATFVNDLQTANPSERVLVLGNFNAHPFNDGYVDVMGTVLGTPAAASRVVLASPSLVSRPLHDLMAALPDSLRYSSIADGNAQALDHLLASANLIDQLQNVAVARVNADFPEVLRDTTGDPSRLSDRDPVVAFFSFPTDDTAPVFDPAPQNILVPATGPAGAVVNYALPVATDNVDANVVVTCTPAAGSMFSMGSTAVRCSAEDEAGNQATASFTVTVQDTAAPVITVPANINETASSTSGRQVVFTVSANDAVDGPVGVTCVPASGSTFPIGTTVVACSAADTAGNRGHATFTVTITGTQSLHGHMDGSGQVRSGQHKVSFAFDVRESAQLIDRGWLILLSTNSGSWNSNCFVARVDSIVFSNAPGYKPGRSPSNGVDTVTFKGIGHWNGKPNYRFEVSASDRGEPGAGRDTFSVVIKSPSGKVVETMTGVLREGNIQARRR